VANVGTKSTGCMMALMKLGFFKDIKFLNQLIPLSF
jgi:hypothetical protein